MNTENHDTLIRALVRILRPLVRVMLRHGISFGTFAELSRRVFVEVAEQDFALPGKKPTTTRTAVITGLTRKDVTRIKRLPSLTEDDFSARFNRANRVIQGWLNDERFAQAPRQPRPLPLESTETQPGFDALVSAYSGDMTPRAVLDEFVRAGLVKISEDGDVHLLKGAYVPSQDQQEKLALLGSDVADLIDTIDYNLNAEHQDSRFQLKVAYDNLPAEALPLFHRLVSEEGFRLLRQFDAFLASHDRDARPDQQGAGRFRAGAGIYYFEEPFTEGEDTP